jgi:Mrp family chromosome partitioning ATPase
MRLLSAGMRMRSPSADPADGLVLIVEAGATRRDETADAVANLRACKVNILAAVLNKDTSPVPEKISKRL